MIRAKAFEQRPWLEESRDFKTGAMYPPVSSSNVMVLYVYLHESMT